MVLVTGSLLQFIDRETECGTQPDLDKINFDGMESGSKDYGKAFKQSEAFHTNVFGVARDEANNHLTFFATSKL